MLKDKPTQKANWMAFSIAEQMRGNVRQHTMLACLHVLALSRSLAHTHALTLDGEQISRAIDIVTKYEDVSSDERSNTSDDPTKVYENSEFLLYKYVRASRLSLSLSR